MSARKATLFGKYREIIIAVAFFLLFDLGVLILNFYTSFQINEDAVGINLAGRQRMLSQRMTKSVLNIQSLQAEGEPIDGAKAELTKTRALFDRTLKAFVSGGETAGGSGQPVVLRAVESPRGREVLEAASTIWAQYQKVTAPLVAESLTAEDLERAVRTTREINVRLLDSMNDLTGALEAGAADRAEWLRRVQAGGMTLALLNFGFILFKFLRRLRDNDAKIEQAQQENREILDTVSEGLLLLAPDYRVGGQYSASLAGILGREVRGGDDFLGMLSSMVAPATHEAAREYLALLFGDRVKESLVRSLNPLTDVPVTLERQGGARRYLNFEFRRAMVGGTVSHLLVTVADVTEQVELAQELEEARKRAASEVGVLLNLLRAEPHSLATYLDDTQAKLEQINDELRERAGDDDPRRLIDGFCRVVHGIKGEAAALGLDMFETLSHEFELLLLPLRDASRLDADSLLSIPVRLSGFLERIGLVREMTMRIGQMQQRAAARPDEDVAPPSAPAPADVASQLERIARNAADGQNKWLSLSIDLDGLSPLPAPLRNELRDITIQLVRNAVSHGIETPDERRARAKPATGLIEVRARALPDCYELVVRDDGRGMSPLAVREALVRSGQYTEAEVAALDDREVLMKVFEAGVSTAADNASQHAGHGIGMDLVRDKLTRLGARLRCSTRENEFTQFTVRLAN